MIDTVRWPLYDGHCLVVGVGGPSVFVLLSLVNKETALGLLIGQN